MRKEQKSDTRDAGERVTVFLPHFDTYVFCNLLLNRRTATWNLFVLYIVSRTSTNYVLYNNGKLFYFKIFQHTRPLPRLCPLWRTQKKAIWRNLYNSIQNEVISMVTMRSNELWLVQENHATVKKMARAARASLLNENLPRKQN